MNRRLISRCVRSLVVVSFLSSLASHGLTCATGLVASTPTVDFTLDTGVGTALHSKTGLMWDSCSYGQTGTACTGTASNYNWQQAFAAVASANTNNYKGFSDWRLPNVKELMSMVEKCRKNPAVNDEVFPLTSTASGGYWSSTVVSNIATQARYVEFFNGEIFNNTTRLLRTQAKPIRLVRGGQTFSGYAVPKLCDLDINGDSATSADKDAVLLLRYLFGFRGASLIDGVTLGLGRADANAVAAFIGAGSQYDVFGRTVPSVNAMTDGLVLLRMMLAVPDSALLNGIAVPATAQFTAGDTVRANVNGRCGTNL